MIKKILSLSLFALPLLAQQAVIVSPDCILKNASFTGNGNSTVIDNRPNTASGRQSGGCSSWTVTYTAPSTVSALSITLQGAPDNAGTPGTYATLGTVVVGANPSTTTAQSMFSVINGFAGWVRINLASYAGSGTINVSVVGGYVIQSSASSSATVSLTSAATAQADATTNSPRVLTDGSGNAMTNPVYGFVFNGTTWDRARGNVRGAYTQGSLQYGNTDANFNTNIVGGWDYTDGVTVRGNLYQSGSTQGLVVNPGGVAMTSSNMTPSNWRILPDADSDSFSVLNPVIISGRNGTTSVFPAITCSSQATFNLTGSGNTQIIAASGSTVIYICGISFASSATFDFKLTSGTGSNCGTGTADVTGLYKGVISVDLEPGPFAPIRGPAAAAICINQSAANTTGGLVSYAQF